MAYLDEADSLPLIVELRRIAAERLALRPGAALVDVGCGTGTALCELAGRIAPGGRAVGVDLSEEMLAVAAGRAPAWVELVRADAAALPFEEESFDAYRAERIYQHLADPAGALDEARRVLRPGGRIVLVEPDWDGLLVDVDRRDVLRRALDATIATRPGTTVGRRLPRLLREAGFARVDATGVLPSVTDFGVADRLLLAGLVFTDAAAAGAGADELAGLRAELQERAEQGAFFAALPVFVVAAERP